VKADTPTGGYRQEIRATANLFAWGLAWIATLALARFGPELLWGPTQQVASWAAVILNLAAGIGWIVAFTRFLRAVDELQRQIILGALAITLGAGWVAGLGYVVADAAGLLSFDVDIAAFSVFLGIVFLITFLVGRIRYR
jgi:hypothetical protein